MGLEARISFDPPPVDPQPPNAAEVRETLRRAVNRVCPPWLSDHSEDIVQAAWLKVSRWFQEQPPDAPLHNRYLWKTATSAVLNEIRRRRHERRGESLEAVADHASGSGDPDSSLRARRIREAIAECMEQIVAPRRRALALQLLGYSAEEVATSLNADTKRARNLIFRGMNDLRDCLEGKGVTP